MLFKVLRECCSQQCVCVHLLCQLIVTFLKSHFLNCAQKVTNCFLKLSFSEAMHFWGGEKPPKQNMNKLSNTVRVSKKTFKKKQKRLTFCAEFIHLGIFNRLHFSFHVLKTTPARPLSSVLHASKTNIYQLDSHVSSMFCTLVVCVCLSQLSDVSFFFSKVRKLLSSSLLTLLLSLEYLCVDMHAVCLFFCNSPTLFLGEVADKFQLLHPSDVP